MARNVDLKARIASVESLLPKAAALASERPLEFEQDDTFFPCETGRLKLRDFLDGSGELIFYRRANQSGPKESFYLRSATSTPGVLRESLSLAYGQSGRVVKRRTVFLVGRTRVHLDRVEGLGHFLELEVVLAENEPSEAGVREAGELMSRLGIEPHQLVEGAYVELFGREGG
jgi:adenylate cyclase class IV